MLRIKWNHVGESHYGKIQELYSHYVKGNHVVYVKHWFGNLTVYVFITVQRLVNHVILDKSLFIFQ